jgi:hypothetical protein
VLALSAASKPKVVVNTAIARKMVGVIWAIARIAQPAISRSGKFPPLSGNPPLARYLAIRPQATIYGNSTFEH